MQSYVNGYFRDAFTDAQTLNVAVLAALRDLPQASTGAEWTSLHEPAPLVWRWQVAAVQDPGLHAPVLDVHLVPIEVQPLRTTQLQALPPLLTRSAREHGFFNDTEAVEASSAADLAWSWVRETSANAGFFTARREHQHRGLLVHRNGQVTAFEALPTDSMGALVSAPDLQQRLARLVRFVGPSSAREGQDHRVGGLFEAAGHRLRGRSGRCRGSPSGHVANRSWCCGSHESDHSGLHPYAP